MVIFSIILFWKCYQFVLIQKQFMQKHSIGDTGNRTRSLLSESIDLNQRQLGHLHESTFLSFWNLRISLLKFETKLILSYYFSLVSVRLFCVVFHPLCGLEMMITNNRVMKRTCLKHGLLIKACFLDFCHWTAMCEPFMRKSKDYVTWKTAVNCDISGKMFISKLLRITIIQYSFLPQLLSTISLYNESVRESFKVLEHEKNLRIN